MLATQRVSSFRPQTSRTANHHVRRTRSGSHRPTSIGERSYSNPFPFDRKFDIHEDNDTELNRVRVVSAILLERPQIVCPDPFPWQVEWWIIEANRIHQQRVLQKAAAEKRVVDELAFRGKKESASAKKKREKEQKKKGKGATEEAPQEHKKMNEDDREKTAVKAVQEERVIYPLITPEDQADNRKSLYRKLTTRLYLLVKKDRKDNAWGFPQGGHEEVDGDSLRKTAEREIGEELGDKLSAYFLGNAPVAHWEYPIQHKDYDKTKAFLFKVEYIWGELKLSPELVDYVWVTKAQAKEYLSPELYESVKDAMVGEEPFEDPLKGTYEETNYDGQVDEEPQE